MPNSLFYEYMLSRITDQLADFGYSRSGKSALFYRYSADKTVASAIEMQRSIFNSEDSFSFTFNLLCIGLYDLEGFFNDKLTLSAIKGSLKSPFLAERIGIICRGSDYWWTVDEEYIKKYTPEKYYDIFIREDIEKAAKHLDDLFEKKKQKYEEYKLCSDL